MSELMTKEDFLQAAAPPLITLAQADYIAKLAAKYALEAREEYASQFDLLPEKISQTQISNFLEVAKSTVNAWAQAGKLPLQRPAGQHPYIIKREFILVCRKNDWLK